MGESPRTRDVHWRPPGGWFLIVHSGLLDDERMNDLPPTMRGAWLWLYLQLDREPDRGVFKDGDRVTWILRRGGWSRDGAYRAYLKLLDTGWLIQREDGALTIRHWDWYQTRGRKAFYNQTRPTTREGRKKAAAYGPTSAPKGVEPGGDSVEPQNKTTPTPTVSFVDARARASGPSDGVDKPPRGYLKAKLREHGYNPGGGS